MPETSEIVINTSPLIALVAAWGDLFLLQTLYAQLHVPFEVSQEIGRGGTTNFAVAEFERATWLKKQDSPLQISSWLRNSLDLGEASVIQLALNKGIDVVCIDEAIGRRVARLNGLSLTGSIGILLKGKRNYSARLPLREASYTLFRYSASFKPFPWSSICPHPKSLSPRRGTSIQSPFSRSLSEAEGERRGWGMRADLTQCPS